ncbi:hypothetical protein [Streptomyces sp. TLI_171]|uniref:hypothetical protein n=1 Tax=Streptomyces sp. TLI_171 TaxID=1938859 RepID=UPI000C18D838|nr:hypothetical protein [Streptomyces sp. TLI_171]RKE23438.1 hypothetical protein BX266_6906 [Streptomyces sp. TLI_171]
MSTPSARTIGPIGAVYLRCYPFDTWEMASHQAAIRAFARTRGYWDPEVFLDNGRRSGVALPQLDALSALVGAGWCEVVFVPGLWVFSVDDGDARATAERLKRLGGRVEEVPDPRRAARSRPLLRSGTG